MAENTHITQNIGAHIGNNIHNQDIFNTLVNFKTINTS